MLWTVLKKELIVEWRSREVLYTSVFFAVLLATTFMFSFFQGEAQTSGAGSKVGPGILWVGLIFAAIIAFERSFARESECIAALRLVPGIHRPLFFGKCAANIILLAVVELVLIPAVALFFSMPLWKIGPGLVLLLALATVGLCTVGTLLSAALVNIRLREILLPLVLFPLAVPVLVAGVNGTEAMIRESGAEFWDWTRLMIAFDAIYIVLADWLFRPILEATE